MAMEHFGAGARCRKYDIVSGMHAAVLALRQIFRVKCVSGHTRLALGERQALLLEVKPGIAAGLVRSRISDAFEVSS